MPHSEQARWFNEQIQPHEGALRSYLRGQFPAVRDVDDVVQESYLHIWRRRADRPIASAKAFLFTVARHLALDVVRHDRRSPIDTGMDLASLEVADEGSSVVLRASRAEKVRLLVEAIDALPPKCREVVILRKLRFLSQQEVATRLGISEKGVEVQLTRGFARCREHLQRRGVRSLFADET